MNYSQDILLQQIYMHAIYIYIFMYILPIHHAMALWSRCSEQLMFWSRSNYIYIYNIYVCRNYSGAFLYGLCAHIYVQNTTYVYIIICYLIFSCSFLFCIEFSVYCTGFRFQKNLFWFFLYIYLYMCTWIFVYFL